MRTAEEMLIEGARLHQAGQLAEAEKMYREVLRQNPRQPHALNALGVLANQIERPDLAIGYFRQALSILPEQAELYCNLGTAYKTCGDVVSAVALYREALRLKPDYATGYIYLCDALIEQGRLDEARAQCLEALRLEADCALAYCRLGEFVSQGYHVFTAAEIAAMQAMLGDPRQASQHVGLYFTLAAHWEQQGETDEAFRCYRQGNELKRETYRQTGQLFDPDQHRRHVDALIETFTPELFARTRSFGHESEQPIFVVGMVRSGTSLVEQILSSHPHVFGAGELKEMGQIAHGMPRWLESRGEGRDAKGELQAPQPSAFPECVSRLDAAGSRQLAQAYLQRLTQLGGRSAARVIDKMPHNHLLLGLIALLLPRSHIVHCRRNPLDVCLSAYVQNFKSLTYGTRLEDLGAYYKEYERIMEHWKRVLPMPVHEVAYEEMVAAQEAVSRRLLSFCGLPWDDRCLTFHKSTHGVKTASRVQVRRPIYRHAVNRWERFETHLQPLRDVLAGRVCQK